LTRAKLFGLFLTQRRENATNDGRKKAEQNALGGIGRNELGETKKKKLKYLNGHRKSWVGVKRRKTREVEERTEHQENNIEEREHKKGKAEGPDMD